jgi:hypothetical protein
MQPVKFPGHNLTLAEDQPQYRPLPVCWEGGNEKPMTSCWKLTWKERILIFFTGKLYIRQLTFGNSFQPLMPMASWKEPHCLNCGDLVGKHKKPSFYCPKNLN